MSDNGKADRGLMAALSAFEAVSLGDKKGYEAAIKKTQQLVKCPIKQLAMVDTILDARDRAYGKSSRDWRV